MFEKQKKSTSNRKVSARKQELKQAAYNFTSILKQRENRISELRKKVLEQLSRLQSEAALLKKST